MPGRRWRPVTDELYKKIKAFRTAMCLIKEMLNSGIITDNDYAEIESIIAENTGLISSTIYR